MAKRRVLLFMSPAPAWRDAEARGRAAEASAADDRHQGFQPGEALIMFSCGEIIWPAFDTLSNGAAAVSSHAHGHVLPGIAMAHMSGHLGRWKQRSTFANKKCRTPREKH